MNRPILHGSSSSPPSALNLTSGLIANLALNGLAMDMEIGFSPPGVSDNSPEVGALERTACLTAASDAARSACHYTDARNVAYFYAEARPWQLQGFPPVPRFAPSLCRARAVADRLCLRQRFFAVRPSSSFLLISAELYASARLRWTNSESSARNKRQRVLSCGDGRMN